MADRPMTASEHTKKDWARFGYYEVVYSPKHDWPEGCRLRQHVMRLLLRHGNGTPGMVVRDQDGTLHALWGEVGKRQHIVKLS